MRELKGFVLGVLVCAVLFGGIVYAATTTKTIQVTYSGIKMTLDGDEIIPKDALGNSVEPFAYNGSTYLPVRAVAEAFGKNVEWDGKNNTIVFSSEKEVEKPKGTDLSTLDYGNYQEAYDSNAVTFVKNGGVAVDWDKKQYKTGLVFNLNSTYTFTLFEEDEVSVSLDFTLGKKYRTLAGKAFFPYKLDLVDWGRFGEHRSDEGIDVYFYGDGKLLKKIDNVFTLRPTDFDIDVKGVNKLTIAIHHKDGYYGRKFVLGNLFVEE